MWRVIGSVVLMSASLAACDQAEASRKVIEAECLEGGDSPEVCTCLARQSIERLDSALVELVVLGARGRQAEASEKLETLENQLQAEFEAEVPEIMASCGVQN